MCALLMSIGCTRSGSDSAIVLRFDSKGEFKIAQFTDVHYDAKSEGSRVHSTEIIRSILQREQPDLAILTGDIVTDSPAFEGWQTIADLFAESRTPWCVVMGNHDGEALEGGVTKDELFKMLETKPYFVGRAGEQMYGVGNYDLEIRASGSDSTAAVIYCIDSNDYPSNHKDGSYDWIHHDQIQWYRQRSAQHTAANSGEPLPSLSFMHIPPQEYALLEGNNTTKGNKLEGIASSDLNSGIVASMVEAADVMGLFVGHDHNNDFIGIWHNIALGFGRVTGVDAYGDLERGSRIIRLYENKFEFDSWISTKDSTEGIYYYPMGMSSDDEQNMNYLPALNVKTGANGVHYKYYEGGRLKHTDAIAKTKLVGEGTVSNITLEPALRSDSIGLVFDSYIDIPVRGVYCFYTYSDDGSKLLIDGTVVVDNDNSHSAQSAEGSIALEAGMHHLRVLYFQDYMGRKLEVGMWGRKIRTGPISAKMLFTSADTNYPQTN